LEEVVFELGALDVLLLDGVLRGSEFERLLEPLDIGSFWSAIASTTSSTVLPLFKCLATASTKRGRTSAMADSTIDDRVSVAIY
jgi:hypothetical protein